MIAILDSTAIIHSNSHGNKMKTILLENDIKTGLITRINYLEILSGASENAKIEIKKYLQQFAILEIDTKAINIANKLATQVRVGRNNQKDFLIASIAIANKIPILTENIKDFQFSNLKLLGYKIK